MRYYAQGIKYDTTDSRGEFDFIISDETGWLVLPVRDIIEL